MQGPYEVAMAEAEKQEPDRKRVWGLLEQALSKGDKRAAYALGTWYLHGRFVPRNLTKALKLLRDAAAADVPDALYDLAVCYEEGTGVQKSLKRAVALYVEAALHGEKQSLYQVGRCYYYGIGVAADRSVARVWLDRAKQEGIR